MYKPIGLQVKTYRFSCAKPIGFCPLKLCFLSAVSQLFVYACTKIVDTTERYRLNELTLSSLSSLLKFFLVHLVMFHLYHFIFSELR